MPCISDDGESRRKQLKERKAKLIALRIDPRSLKFEKLLHRRRY